MKDREVKERQNVGEEEYEKGDRKKKKTVEKKEEREEELVRVYSFR
jgi:hypothetical protein